MDKRDLVKLRKNYPFLLTTLDVDTVLDYLYQERVLSLDDMERVRAEVTSQDKARKLLSMLPKRTKDAYTQLLAAFDLAELSFITKQLEETTITQEEVDSLPNTLDLGPLDSISHEEVLYAIQTELRQRYIEQFLRADPLPWSDDMVLSLPDVYTELDLRERDTYHRAVNNDPIPLVDIFKEAKSPRPSQPPKRIYIQGIAGMGKTVLCNKLAYDWACNEATCCVGRFVAVFFLEMKEGVAKSCLSDTIFDQLLPVDFKYSKQSVLDCIHEFQSDMLLLIDGYDELSSQDKKSVEAFLQGKYLHQINCLLTSRPTHLAAKYFDRRLKCNGFSQERAREFIGKYFTDQPVAYYQGLVDQVENSCYLRQLVENPLDCLLLCIQWEDNKGTLPRSLSQLFSDIVNIIVLRYFAKHCNGLGGAEEDSAECQNLLMGLKELAFKSLLEGRREVTMSEIKAVPEFQNVLKLGVLHRVQPKSRLSGEVKYSFNQRNIQEILAAMYVPLLSQDERRRVFKQFLSDRQTAILVIFIMGIFKGDDDILKDLFNILGENNRKNDVCISFKIHEDCTEESPYVTVDFNKTTRPYTISYHSLNEAESKQKFLSVIAASMPKNFFMDLKILRNHYSCHNMSHSCYLVLESMPCPDRVMIMELSFYLEDDPVRAVNKTFDVLKHVALKDPKPFELFIYCDGLNFSGYSSIPFFVNNLMDFMAVNNNGKFFENRVKSLSFLLPDCYRLREMCVAELEDEMKLNKPAPHVHLPPLIVYTDVKCDHLYDHLVMDEEARAKMFCPAKMAAHVLKEVNPQFDIQWRRAVMPTGFIQEIY